MAHNHINGPWHVSGSKVPIVYDSSGWAVCNATVFHGRHDEGQSMANAHLIAAAPELLEALELIDSHLTRCINFSGINTELRERLEQQQHNARAAIAKARGAS